MQMKISSMPNINIFSQRHHTCTLFIDEHSMVAMAAADEAAVNIDVGSIVLLFYCLLCEC